MALVKALLAGDEKAYDRFFNEYYPRVYRFVLARSDGDDDLAQELSQVTLINALRAMDSYRGEASMFTWLCQICRNELSAHYRRLNRSVPTVAADDAGIAPILAALEASDGDDPAARTSRLQVVQLIQEVLDRLPGNYGDALEWKYIHGESVSVIADRLDITQLAAQSLLARAREALREALVALSPELQRRTS
ncbi:MAG: RNA polymerase sigma factor [Halieaceae bacterium]|nr:RNA polymerase sigma factor [Halieaceae bacterium]